MSLFFDNIPYIDVLVRREYTRDMADRVGEWLHGKAFAVECRRGRMLGFQVIFSGEDEKGSRVPSGGAMYRLPIEALAWKPCDKPADINDMAPWDCLSDEFSVVVLNLLAGVRVKTIPNGQPGRYLFTLHLARSDIADDPEQSKQLHVIKMDGGWFGAFPNNRMLALDPAFSWPATEKPDFVPLTRTFSGE